ncbi:Zn-ribbon domain-containing OB-fold protein [Actinomadura madurae]|uniref:Zn-ribbon domain-containing OB-fold protein n=1 Tax=Actinomadura madurae TaxID=1993 RepID=UPI0020D20BE7|nr:OB-fold domain-containing protein [Actinomadura madurae]MCP9948257.1 OB-fold domain-containing protein [Actinomadura madurae]MCP9977520.1 OB-fold domain-containing protein [Actinomadura madurae]MCQ0010983.1 OB-fold domain-containing protein [Actinomadura madurae]
MTRPAGALPADFADIHPDGWTEPFWLATREHRLTIPKCADCDTFRFPPGPFCHVCRHQEVEQVEISGAGTVYTYTVVRHAVVPALAGSVPYVIAVLEFDDAPGIRMIANIVESDVDAVRVGSRVQLAWDDIDDEVTVPRFRLAAG